MWPALRRFIDAPSTTPTPDLLHVKTPMRAEIRILRRDDGSQHDRRDIVHLRPAAFLNGVFARVADDRPGRRRVEDREDQHQHECQHQQPPGQPPQPPHDPAQQRKTPPRGCRGDVISLRMFSVTSHCRVVSRRRASRQAIRAAISCRLAVLARRPPEAGHWYPTAPRAAAPHPHWTAKSG